MGDKGMLPSSTTYLYIKGKGLHTACSVLGIGFQNVDTANAECQEMRDKGGVHSTLNEKWSGCHRFRLT